MFGVLPTRKEKKREEKKENERGSGESSHVVFIASLAVFIYRGLVSSFRTIVKMGGSAKARTLCTLQHSCVHAD